MEAKTLIIYLDGNNSMRASETAETIEELEEKLVHTNEAVIDFIDLRVDHWKNTRPHNEIARTIAHLKRYHPEIMRTVGIYSLIASAYEAGYKALKRKVESVCQL